MQCSSTIGANVLAAAPQARLQRRQRAAGLAGASLRPCSAPGARPTRLGNSQHADNRPGRCAAAQQEEVQGGAPPPPERQPEQPALVGEDAAVFDLSQQSLRSWVIFGALLTGVLAMLYPVWIAPGLGLGDDFIAALSSVSEDSSVVMLAILLVFAIAHSGLAFLRPYGEELVGARAYRVMFALVSLPLAIAAVVYFIDHRYDGIPLWNVRGVPGVHALVWALSFVSFYFLYPSTFNILEVAAVDEPKLHMWETGIMRITRHPQMVGQFIWCAAHTLWVGSSFMVVTSLGLMAHHLFGCWHGDFRLKRKYGEKFEEVEARTSTQHLSYLSFAGSNSNV